MKPLHTLTLACGFSLAAAAAQAAPVQLTFDLVVGDINGSPIANGNGTLSFDDSDLTGVGFESLARTTDSADFADPTLAIDFVLGGLPFSTSNDIDFPDFPIFSFFDGILESVDFVMTDGFNGVDLTPLGLDGQAIEFGEAIYDPQGALGFIGVASNVAPIPLPAGGILLLSALGLGGVAARRKNKAA